MPKTSAKGAAGQRRRTFVVMEAICQRTGRLAPLKELVELKDKYGALLVLDESLSFGALGAQGGRGLSEHCGIEANRIDAVIGSLEHAVGGVGGFCAGRRGLVEHQRLAGAGYCFANPCPPSACAAAIAVIEDLSTPEGIQRRLRLAANSALLHTALNKLVSSQDSKLQLVSVADSYVQILRWLDVVSVSDETGADAVDARLLAVISRCSETKDGSPSAALQLCSGNLCGAERAFGVRIRAPALDMAPSLRACVSAKHSPEDIEAFAASIGAALRAESLC